MNEGKLELKLKTTLNLSLKGYLDVYMDKFWRSLIFSFRSWNFAKI